MSKYYKIYCCAYGCLNKAKTVLGSELSYFLLPKDERRREWLTAINREDLLDEKNVNKSNTYHVCSAHFDESSITTLYSKRLKKDAVPIKLSHEKSHKSIQNRNLIMTRNSTSTEALPQSSEDNSFHLPQKDNVLVTHRHTQSQTDTQPHKASSNEKEIKPFAKPKINTLMNKTEPATSTSNSQSKVRVLSNIKIKMKTSASTSTQTDFKETINKNTQTTTDLTENTPRKSKLKEEETFVKCKRRRLEQEVSQIQKEFESKNASLLFESEDEVTQRFMKLVKWQNKIKNKFKGNRYDAEYKVFALNLHYASPHAYRCLQTVLKLPTKSTLHKLKLKVPPKLDDSVLNSLSLKIKSLPAKAKYCTLCVNEMVLKRSLYYDITKDEVIGFHNINGTTTPEIASCAYVIMLQGIYCDWKQPIAYALLGSNKHYSELDSWMNEVILKLFSVGIEIKAILSDQGSNFDKYAKVVKNVTIDKPYFLVNEHKIFFIFNVPHLLKSVRNNLLSSNFHYKGEIISWDHIKTLYEHQKDKHLRLIPKITKAHIEPNNFQKTRVKYAAQIFSNTVYAALETYIDFGKITEEARGTAKFIKIMGDIFDVLNSSKIKSDAKYQAAFRMYTEQNSILQEAQHMFATIKSTNCSTRKDNTNQIKTFNNFQITIQSVLQLFEDLKSEGFQYLFTRRLNQDSLDLFFESVRQQSGSCSEPTPIQFTRAFSKLFYANMLKSDQTDLVSDISEMLLKAEDVISKQTFISSSGQAKPSLVALNGEIDYRIDLPEANALTYIAGFLLFKCSQKHSDCKEMLSTLDSSLNLAQTSTHYKAYNKNKSFYGHIKMPTQEMKEYIEKLETVFAHNFAHYVHGNPGSEIFKLLQEIELPILPCSCFPVDYLLRLFVRLRVFSTLKFNNKNMKSGTKSVKQYLKIKQLG